MQSTYKELSTTEQAFLALEAKRFRYAFEYDPILGMSVSKVDPLPHQIEAVYEHVLKKSRIRFMLAHDPGAGKTVMAGLIIKELELREDKKRVLIVVPGQLKEQWRWELQDKFDDKFEVVDRAYFTDNGKGDVWEMDHIITSIDFAKREDIAETLHYATKFDLVIVDEAHKMSAYSSGKSTSKTRRYRLGEIVSNKTEHLLFLTATPHKGDTKNFQLLLDLLEPGYLAGRNMIETSIKKRDNPLFLRRAKEDMVDFDNKPLFMPRSVETPDVRLSTAEKALYSAMSRYVKEQYNLAVQSAKGHNITFALIILQRRFASSAFALLESLKRRKNKLEKLKEEPETSAAAVATMESADEMSESERWIEESKWELLSMAQSVEDLQTEIDTIDKLIKKTENVLKKGAETKLKQLKKTIDELDKSSPGEKILVFTESRDTMNHLVSNIESWGYSVNTIHGAMAPKERRNAETVFKEKTQIMVATEAAGEGINLQFCHLMVNYDLPWNPNRLEQRMGRIHRYGQKHPVYVFNMVAADTREGEIMQLLFEKLELIKEAMGSDKIFDVISEIVPGKSLSQMLLDATVRARQQKTIINELDSVLSVNNKDVMRHINDGLASKYIDYSSVKGLEAAKEKQLVPEYTRDLFERILAMNGGEVEWSDDVACIRMPPAITRDGVEEEYTSATFDKRVRMANPGTELITFGHPAFNAALDWAEHQYSEAAMSGAAFLDGSGRLDGHIVFAEGSVYDGSGSQIGRQLFAVYVDRNKSASSISPSVLLDFELHPDGMQSKDDLQEVKEIAAARSADMLKDFADMLAKDRGKEVDLDKRYGLESLDALIGNINREIRELLDKKRRGKKMDLAIYNKRQERQKYRLDRKGLGKRIKHKVELSIGDIAVVGVARIYPASGDTATKTRDAIMAAKVFEFSNGRSPEILSGQGYGFDIRSTVSENNYMYIQVKVPTEDGHVVFTPNEWLRAKMLRDRCQMYCADGDDMLRVADPAAVIKTEHIKTGYRASVERIKELASV